jgi:hypothetical protein
VHVWELNAGDSLLSGDGAERELLEIRAVASNHQVYHFNFISPNVRLRTEAAMMPVGADAG